MVAPEVLLGAALALPHLMAEGVLEPLEPFSLAWPGEAEPFRELWRLLSRTVDATSKAEPMDRLPNGARPDLARRPVCDLETIGRRSGLPRLIEIWFAADLERDRIYVLSEPRPRPRVRNCVATGSSESRSMAARTPGFPIEIEGDQDDALARRLLAAKYQGWW